MPQSPIEEMLVELIAICYWRYRRFIKAEKGEIRKHSDSLSSQIKQNSIKEYESSKLFSGIGNGNPETINNAQVLKDILKFLKETAEDLDSLGYFSDLTFKKMTEYFGRDSGSLTVLYMVHNMGYKGQAELLIIEEKDPREAPGMDASIKLVLKSFEKEKRQVQAQLESIENRNRLELSSRALSANIPPGNIMDRFIRYGSSILRQLYKAISELERIQRKRQGDFVPPPVNIEVGVDKN